MTTCFGLNSLLTSKLNLFINSKHTECNTSSIQKFTCVKHKGMHQADIKTYALATPNTVRVVDPCDRPGTSCIDSNNKCLIKTTTVPSSVAR